MLTASQDIDSFIERQRSKLNNHAPRQQNNRQPPPQPTRLSNNPQDRLDFKVARILDEPPPRNQAQQPYHAPPSPPSYHNNNNNSMSEQQENFYPEQQQQRRFSDDNNDKNSSTFFNKFGAYEDKRSQLKDDLKREYNEFLQAQRGVPKSKSTSQLAPARAEDTNKRVQFQPSNGKVVAPWEKNDKKTMKNVHSMNDISPSAGAPPPPPPIEYSNNRSRPQMSRNYDDQHIQDREEYVSELHAQIRELELRKKQLEIESSRLSAGTSSTVVRAHYNEDLNALNSLLAERLDQRNAVDHELAHILNRPPLSSSPTRIGSGGIPNLNMPSNGYSNQGPPQQRNPQQQHGRQAQPYRNDNRSAPNDNGFQIGQDVDKDAEQAQKKRYQQELQAQMREVQMRKAQEKHAKDDYERKLDEEIQRYNYFGRSGGGGAPMRDRDGNVVANLADVRNPPPPQQMQQPHPQQMQQQHPQQQQYYPPDDKVYSLGNGTSSIANAPFYNGGQEQQHPPNMDNMDSPNHARGAVSNGIFGTAKTDVQIQREERYKLDLKQQIDEKRQREAEEVARRRAEEERELAKHLEWQQQMDRQTAEDAVRKQEKEAQDRLQQQQLHEELDRQRKQEETAMKRKPKRQEKPMTPKRNDNEDNDGNNDRRNEYDEQQQQQQQHHQPTEAAYRSSSPPIPALKNKDKKKPKPTTTNNNVRKQSFDDANQQQSPPPFHNNDDFDQLPPIDDVVSHGQQTYRKPPTPRQPDVTSARKKPPPQKYQSRARLNSNSGMPMRTMSTTSLRSDGSDSEVLNRLEHLKRQLKDKEARLQDHVNVHQTKSNSTSNTNEQSKSTYQPPAQRKQSPGFLFNAARVHHHRESPTTTDKVRHILQTDDDIDFNPSYFRDDTILMNGNPKQTTNDYYSSSKRIDSANRMFATKTEKEANRRRYGHESPGYFEHEDPTNMANYELNRIAAQNEQRLKKLRDLENDDASLLDSNEVLERFQQKQRLYQGGSQTTLQDDAWLK